MKLRWKFLFGFLALFVLPLIFLLLVHWKVKREADSYRKQLTEKGEKLGIADWIPFANASGETTRAFLESVSALADQNRDRHPTIMRMVAMGRAQTSWKSDDIFDTASQRSTNLWPMLGEDLKAGAVTLEEMRESCESGHLVFPVAYEQGFNALLPHLVRLKEGELWLAAASLYELHEGWPKEAKANLIALLRLLESYQGEPLIISHLVRFSCLQIAFGTTWETLQSPSWNEADLKDFQDSWEAIGIGDLQAVFSMERAMGLQLIAAARESEKVRSDYFANGLSGGNTLADDLGEFTSEFRDNPRAAFKALFRRPNEMLWPWIQSYQEERTLMQVWHEGLDADRAIERAKTYQPTLKMVSGNLVLSPPSGDDPWMSYSQTSVPKILARFAAARATRQLVITACALQRYKLANERYPTELKQLIPKFLPTLPMDPIDGAPLRYRLKPEGIYKLYSIGENGVDEGGDPNREGIPKGSAWVRPSHPLNGRDWVWPQEATEEQIEEWESHESGKARP